MEPTTNELPKIVTKTVYVEGVVLTKEESKAVFKEAMKEWLTDQRKEVETTIGKWAIRFIATATIFALGYFVLRMSGWQRII